MGPCPIQLTEIEAYLRIVEIEESDTKMKYVRLIRLMDVVELNFIHQKSKQQAKRT